MKIKYTIHRKSKLVGTVADVDADLGCRLIAAGQAVAVGDRVAVPARQGPASAEAIVTDAATATALAEQVDKPADKAGDKAAGSGRGRG